MNATDLADRPSASGALQVADAAHRPGVDLA